MGSNSMTKGILKRGNNVAISTGTFVDLANKVGDFGEVDGVSKKKDRDEILAGILEKFDVDGNGVDIICEYHNRLVAEAEDSAYRKGFHAGKSEKLDNSIEHLRAKIHKNHDTIFEGVRHAEKAAESAFRQTAKVFDWQKSNFGLVMLMSLILMILSIVQITKIEKLSKKQEAQGLKMERDQ